MESPLLYFGLQRQVKKKRVSIFSFGSAYYNFKDKVRVLGVGAVSVLNFIESRIFYSRVFFRSFVFSNFYFLLNYAYSRSPFSFSVLEFFSRKTNIVGGVSQGGQFFDWEVEEDIQSGLGYVGVLQRYAGLIILAELGCRVEDIGETDVNSQSAFEKCKDKVTGLGLFLGTALFKIKNTCFNVLFGS